MSAKHLLVCMHKLYLSGRGGRLEIREPGTTRVDADYRAAERDCTRRHDKDLTALGLQRHNVFCQPFEPVTTQLAAIADQQRGADLYNQSLVISQGESGHRQADR